MTAKPRSAITESKAARAQAEREAAEHSRQKASRQTRALKRSNSATNNTHSQLRTSRGRLPRVKSTRLTTMSFSHRVSKAGALKGVQQSLHHRAGSQRNKSALNTKNRLRPLVLPSTPTRNSPGFESDSEENPTPNITPASLRSASRLVEPTNYRVPEASTNIGLGEPTTMSRPSRTLAASRSQTQQRVSSVTHDESSGSSIQSRKKKLYRSVQSRSRSRSGRLASAS